MEEDLVDLERGDLSPAVDLLLQPAGEEWYLIAEHAFVAVRNQPAVNAASLAAGLFS
jgi:hypothetical protein